MPRAQRSEPLHLQVSGHYKQEILEGRLAEGARLTSIRDIAAEWGVGQNVAQRAVEQLKTEGLVTTSGAGTFVAPRRAVLGPEQRLRLAAHPAGETETVRFAGLVTAPRYILPILGLEPGGTVIRREWLTLGADGRPARLSVTWCPPQFAQAVPELLAAVPLPDPGGAAAMIAARTGHRIEWGRTGREARRVKDDDREAPALGLGPDASVLAEVYWWVAGETVLEYTEFIVPQGQVVESDLEP